MKLVRSAGIVVGALATLALAAGPASAHDCFNTQKAAGSGGVAGTYVVATNTFTPSGAPGNPVFVEVIFPDGSSGFGYGHAAGPHGVIPAARDCDGKGIDSFEACFG